MGSERSDLCREKLEAVLSGNSEGIELGRTQYCPAHLDQTTQTGCSCFQLAVGTVHQRVQVESAQRGGSSSRASV